MVEPYLRIQFKINMKTLLLAVALFSFISEYLCVYTCPDTFEKYGEKCYKVMRLTATWMDAKKYCDVIGADLVSIETSAEEAIIQGLVVANHGHQSPEIYWTAGSDMLREGEWRWMGKNGHFEKITFTNWNRGEPSNGGPSGNENCMVLTYSNGQHWNDAPCSEPNYHFICEANIKSRNIDPSLITVG